MRAAAIATLILLLPAALFAGTVGMYFTYTPNQMYYNPAPFEPFTGYVYGHGLNCYVNAFEFKLVLPAGIITQGFVIPEGSLTLGDLATGLSITYWPPLNGVDPGYNLLCTVNLLALPNGACACLGGALTNGLVCIGPTNDSGALLPRESCWPENNLVEVTGLTSMLCVDQVATQNASWGAIKSLF